MEDFRSVPPTPILIVVSPGLLGYSCGGEERGLPEMDFDGSVGWNVFAREIMRGLMDVDEPS